MLDQGSDAEDISIPFEFLPSHQTRFIVDIPHSNSQPLAVSHSPFRVARCICSNLHNLFMGDTDLCYDSLHAPPSWQQPFLLFIGPS